MKKLITLILLCSFSAIFGQNDSLSLRVRDIMNFEIGDIFHYTYNDYTPGGTNIKIIRKALINKAYNNDSSVLTYTFDRLIYGKTSETGTWCTHTRDSVTSSYTNLDSICYSLFPETNGQVYANTCNNNSFYSPTYQENSDTNFYNNRLTAKAYSGSNYYLFFVAGLGEVRRYSTYTYCVEQEQLIYYQKGNETWGTPDTTLLLQNPLPTPIILTKADVYDFNVGDVFQLERIRFGYGYTFTNYIERTVLERDIYGTDSVVYQILEKDTSIYANGGTLPYVPPKQVRLSYVNLNEPVKEASCYLTAHIQDTCGYIPYNHYQYSTSGYATYSYFFKGLGAYIGGMTMQFPASEGTHDNLRYFHKANQNLSCGTYFAFPKDSIIIPIDTGTFSFQIKQNIQDKTFEITLNYLEEALDIEIMNMSGQILLKEKIAADNSIIKLRLDTQSFARGIYIISLKNNQISVSQKEAILFD